MGSAERATITGYEEFKSRRGEFQRIRQKKAAERVRLILGDSTLETRLIELWVKVGNAIPSLFKVTFGRQEIRGENVIEFKDIEQHRPVA